MIKVHNCSLYLIRTIFRLHIVKKWFFQKYQVLTKPRECCHVVTFSIVLWSSLPNDWIAFALVVSIKYSSLAKVAEIVFLLLVLLPYHSVYDEQVGFPVEPHWILSLFDMRFQSLPFLYLWHKSVRVMHTAMFMLLN